MTNYAAVKFVKPECRATSPNKETSAAMVRPFYQTVPGKIGEASTARHTHGKAAQSRLRTLRRNMVRSWCGPAQPSEIDENREVVQAT